MRGSCQPDTLSRGASAFHHSSCTSPGSPGWSPAGHRAASHTAAAATPLVNQKAMFDLAGVIATRSLGELVDTVALLACQAAAGGATGSRSWPMQAAQARWPPTPAPTTPAGRGRRGHPSARCALLSAAAVATGPLDTSPVVTTETFRACLEEVAADDGVTRCSRWRCPRLPRLRRGSRGGHQQAVGRLPRPGRVRATAQAPACRTAVGRPNTRRRRRGALQRPTRQRRSGGGSRRRGGGGRYRSALLRRPR